MKIFNKYVAVIGLLCTGLTTNAQSDGCSAATPIAVTANCSTPTAGTTTGATQTIPGCVGTADDDVWYSFVATSTSHQITVDGAVGFDAVAQLFSNTCSLLTSLNCQDGTLDGGVETIFATGLTIGNTYRIRVYDYYAGSGTGNFTICVTVGPTPPSNDFCASAIPLAVNGSCSYTSGTSLGATQTMAGCSGTADDDVWFSFVATNSVQTITVDPSSNMDPVVQLLDGACITFTSLYCEDAGFTNGNEVISAVGLVPGATYYVRVYDYYNATGGDAFDICVTGTATSAPVNDDPCNAIQLPPVTAACDYLNFTTTGATASLGAPTPASCVGGSAPQQGGFNASSADVWFAITVPASGSIYVSPEPNSGINDAVMSLYSGTCGSLTQIACSDDHNFPGGANDFKPYIAETGLTPGSTVYLRYWGYGTAQGDFGICVSAPTNDACVDALYICDINGYSASTSAAYTPDRPGTGAGQMYGNNELPDGTPQPNGTNTGGPFGGAVIDVEIDNNSWIQFTASATTATLTVTVYDCWVGSFPSGGIQMEVFSGTNCDNFVSVSNFEENSTGFVITATGLTIGQDYYLMVDGYAGDICSYTITADSGVQFPEITAVPETICAGASTTLTAPTGATGYLWFPGGQTTQAITVNPSTTTTYTCVVEGVCDYKQTLLKTITVNQLPTMTSTTTPADICSGQSVGLSLISDLASNYSWIATSNGSVGGESTSAQSGSTISDVLTNVTGSPQTVTYTVTPTSTVGGCVGNPQTVTVTVNPIPSALTLSSNTPVCVGDPINLTANTVGGGTYSWTGPNSFTSSSEDPTIVSAVSASGGTYNATVTVAGCTSPSASTSVVVNSIPSALTLSSNSPVCVGDPINLTANTVGGGTYSWTGPNTFTSSSEDPTIASAVLASAGTYNATVTVAGCTSPSASTSVTVNSIPSALTLSSNTPVCVGSPINLTANTVGGGTYSWTGSNGFTSSSEDPTIASAVLASGGTYNATVTVSGCTSPSASTSVTVNAIDNASFTYPLATYCATGSDPIATITGLAGGTFTISGAGVINASNGIIDLDASGIASYTVTYTTNGPCPTFSNTTIDITASPDATFSYSAAGYCPVGTTTISQPVGSSTGAFTVAPAGLSINATTGEVNLAASTTGNYTVTNTIVAAGGCALDVATTSIEIYALPTVTASATAPSICDGASVTFTGGGASTYTWDNGVTNGIAFTPGSTGNTTYTVTGTDGNNCVNTSTVDVLVNTLPTVVANANSISLCDGASLTLTGSGASSYTWDNSVTDGVAFTPAVGTVNYTVTGTDGNSCQNTDVIAVTVNALPTVVANASSIAVCDGDPVTLTGSGATSYSWTGGITDGVAFTPPVGVNNYTLIGTDGNTCTNTDAVTVTVTAIDDPSFNYATGSTYCASGTDPIATITGLGGGTFSIDNGGTINGADGTVDLDASGIGAYVITYTTNGTCPTSTTTNINITTAPDATFGYTLPSYCATGNTTVVYPVGSSGGAFSATPAGLAINSSDGSIDLSTSSAGVYTVTNTIVASGGCAADMATTTIEVFALPTVTASSTLPSICDGGSVTFTGGGASSYIWDNGVVDGAAFTPGATGNTTYTVTGTDGNTCSNTATVDVLVNTLPTVVASANSITLCDGASLTLTGSGAASYTWDNSVIDGVSFSPAVGTVNYTVTGTDANTCVNTDQISVTVNALPTIVANASSIAVCDGDPVILTGSGATSYTWTGGVTDGVAFTPSVGVNNYTVTGTDGNTCSNTDVVTVTVTAIDDPSFNYSTGSTYCASGTDPIATVTGLGGGTFSIDNGGTIDPTDGTVDLDISGIGAYVVTYTTNGTCPTSTTLNINITTAPDATFSYSQAAYCQVGTTSPIYPLGSSGGAFTAAPAGLSINGTTGDIDLVNSAPGTYTVTNDIVASGGCAPANATTVITVTPPDDDGFTYSSLAYCSTDPNQIPTINVGGGTFVGTAGLIIDPTTGEVDVASTPFGTYDVTYTTNGTCVNDSTVSVTISGQLDATIALLGGALCETDAVTTLTATDGGGTWSGNGVDASTGDFDPQTAGVGVHTIVYEIVGSCGDIDSIDVVVNLTPNVTVLGDTICDGAVPVLVATGNGGVINWYSDAGLTTLVAADTNIYSPVLSEGIYTFYVQETLNGCSGSIDSANANVFDVSASFTASPESGNIPLLVDLTNTSTVVDTINDAFDWTFGNGETSLDFEPSVTFNEPGTFTITLTVTNEENMCSDSYSVDIVVNGEHTITVPNIFTPNGDGQNDVFAITSENVITLEAVIFDRWGLLIYEWDGVNGGWNGRTKAGIEASEGTYYYLITFTDYKGEVFNLQGPFNLVR